MPLNAKKKRFGFVRLTLWFMIDSELSCTYGWMQSSCLILIVRWRFFFCSKKSLWSGQGSCYPLKMNTYNWWDGDSHGATSTLRIWIVGQNIVTHNSGVHSTFISVSSSFYLFHFFLACLIGGGWGLVCPWSTWCLHNLLYGYLKLQWWSAASSFIPFELDHQQYKLITGRGPSRISGLIAGTGSLFRHHQRDDGMYSTRGYWVLKKSSIIVSWPEESWVRAAGSLEGCVLEVLGRFLIRVPPRQRQDLLVGRDGVGHPRNCRQGSSCRWVIRVQLKTSVLDLFVDQKCTCGDDEGLAGGVDVGLRPWQHPHARQLKERTAA